MGADMNISQETYGHYWEKGWGAVEGVFAPEEVERIARLVLEVTDEEIKQGESSHHIVDYAGDGRIAPRKLNHPFEKGAAFQTFVLDSRLRVIIRDLIGVEPLVFSDQVFMKPPHFGTAKPYHQDNFYFKCHPADHVITVWVAMDDSDAANGCLRYIEGSHKGPVIPHEVPDSEHWHNLVPPPDLIDLSKEVLAEVKKGGVVFHHSKMLHTSHRNESDRWRRGYASLWASAETTSENETIENGNFRRYDFLRN